MRTGFWSRAAGLAIAKVEDKVIDEKVMRVGFEPTNRGLVAWSHHNLKLARLTTSLPHRKPPWELSRALIYCAVHDEQVFASICAQLDSAFAASGWI